MVMEMYSRIIRNLQISGEYQYLQYIHALIMDPEFGLMDNIMPQMIKNLSEMIKMSTGYHKTPILNESMTVP